MILNGLPVFIAQGKEGESERERSSQTVHRYRADGTWQVAAPCLPTAASLCDTHPFTRDGIQCTSDDLRFRDILWVVTLRRMQASIPHFGVTEMKRALLNTLGALVELSHHAFLEFVGPPF